MPNFICSRWLFWRTSSTLKFLNQVRPIIVVLVYSKTCLKRPLKKKTKIGFLERLSLNAGRLKVLTGVDHIPSQTA